MDDQLNLLSVVELLYDSVIDEAKWPVALQSLADFSSGHGAFHIISDPPSGTIVHSMSVGIDLRVNQHYLQYYAAKDVRIPPAIPYAVGQVVTEATLLDRRTYERSELFGELLSPFDIPHIMAAWLTKSTTAFEAVVIQGSRRHGAFERDELDKCSRIVPHLLRAVRMRDLLASARQSNQAYSVLLDSLPLGIVYFDDKGKPIKVSAAAEKVLRQGDALSCVGGQMHARNPDDNRQLQRAILTTCGRRGSATMPGDTIVIRRVNALRPLVVTVIPSGSSQLLVSLPSIAGMMLIIDPEQAPRPRADLIQKAFGLTKSETNLANMLFEGNSLREPHRVPENQSIPASPNSNPFTRRLAAAATSISLRN